MTSISESDEWTGHIKIGVRSIVRSALERERLAIARLIESAMQRANRDSGELAELLSSVLARKQSFGGREI